MSHWTKLRDNFQKCLNRRKLATRSGAANKQLPTCLYFKELGFLTDVIGVRTTSSNISPEIFSVSPLPSSFSPMSQSEGNFEEEMRESISPPPLANKACATTSISQVSPGNEKADILEMNDSSPKAYTAKSAGKPVKRKATDAIDILLAKALVDDVGQRKESKSTESAQFEGPDAMFCKSLIPSLTNLTPKNNKIAKIKIMQVFLDMEEDEN